MAQFRIKGQAADGSRATFLYDNMTSALLHEDGTPVTVKAFTPLIYKGAPAAVAVSRDAPGQKRGITNLKVQLGLLCNYECSYCNQRYVPHAAQTNQGDIEPFLSMLQKADMRSVQRIEFWGGEPLVYWKTLKPLSARLRAMYPRAIFSIITNGSLLDRDKNLWLDAMGFHVAVSHDGPAQSERGPDPLEDTESRAGILDLYRRLHPQGRISINTMMHRANTSRAAVNDYLKGVFGDDVVIGEGSVIDPYDEGGMMQSFTDPHDDMVFRRAAYDDIANNRIGNMHVMHRVREMIDAIANGRPAHTLGQKCNMDKPDQLTTDLNGNLLTCQNVTAAATAPNGEPHKIGDLVNWKQAKLTTSTHWSHRPECPKCPVLQLCKGSCMYLEGDLFATGCNNAFTDHLPFFAVAIAYITGYMPRWIEGPQREDRKDVLGLVNGIPRRKTIPIRVVA